MDANEEQLMLKERSLTSINSFVQLDDNKKGQTSSNRYRNEVIASVGPWLATLLSGYSVGITSSTIADLSEERLLDANQVNWFASLLFLGAVFGSVLSSVLSDKLGRKSSLMLSSAIAAVGWLCIFLADIHIFLSFIGRFLCGLQFGLRAAIAVTYQVETAGEVVRGMVLTIGGALFTGGIMLGFAERIFLSWRWLIATGLLMAVLSIISLISVPESPRWFAKHGRYDEARFSLLWLRMGNSEKIDEELNEIIQKLDQSQLSPELFLSKPILKPLIMAVVLMLSLPFSGHSAISSFLWQIERDMGIDNEAISACILGILQLILFIIITPSFNKFGRRTFLLVGGSVITISLICLSVSDYFQVAWLSYVSLVLYFIGFGIGWTSVPFLVMAEILPTSVRGFGSGIAVAFMLAGMFIFSQTFIPLTAAVTTYGTFSIFAILNTLITIFIAVFIPETRGKTLEEIQSHFE